MPYERDHVPARRDDDPARWAKRFWSRQGHSDLDANVHVRVAGSPNERLALLFRDWFCAHPAAVPAYAAFKAPLAAAIPDLDIYADLEDPVVDLVIAGSGTLGLSDRLDASLEPAMRPGEPESSL